MEAKAASRFFRGVAGGEQHPGVPGVDADAVVDDVEVQIIPFAVTADDGCAAFPSNPWEAACSSMASIEFLTRLTIIW